ncbi:MAG: hypothetical protein FWD17_13025 [Polyangiaceae bacterium]|nr:hypothetical protein [Polyangiaceae bacterium]
MNDPKRLSNGGAAHASALGQLVKTAKADLPDPERLQIMTTAVHARLLDAAMAAAQASPAAAAAGAGAGVLSGAGALLKYGTGVAVVLVAGGAGWIALGEPGTATARDRPEVIALAPSVSSAAALATEMRPSSPPPPLAENALRHETAQLSPSASAPSLAGRGDVGRDSPSPAGAAPSADDLGPAAFPAEALARAEPPEIALLRAAQERLRTNPAAALALTGEHAARYPSGMLAQEGAVIAIEALVRLGRKDEARQRAAELLRTAPRTAHRRRVEELVGALSTTPVHNP